MLDRVKLQHLRYFIAVAEELHFDRAAQGLSLSEQEITEHVRMLEGLLGVPLLTRAGYQLELTPAGEMLLQGGRALLQDTLQLLKQVQDLGVSLGESVKIGFRAGEMHSLVEPVVGQLLTQHPGTNLSRVELPGDALLRALRQGDIDLAVGLQPDLQAADVVFEPLSEGDYRLVLPDTHPLASHDSIAPEQLRQQPILLLSEEGSASNHDICEHFASRGVMLDVVYEPSQADTVKALVEKGTGLWLVPSFAVDQLPPGLLALPVSGFEPLEAGLAWRQDQQSELLQTVVQAFQSRQTGG